jgi:hypothetical protein
VIGQASKSRERCSESQRGNQDGLTAGTALIMTAIGEQYEGAGNETSRCRSGNRSAGNQNGEGGGGGGGRRVADGKSDERDAQRAGSSDAV